MCFESYGDGESGLHVPRLMDCGHTACHGCFAVLLRTALAFTVPGDPTEHKSLECPLCKKMTYVRGGRAKDLTKNFSLMS